MKLLLFGVVKYGDPEGLWLGKQYLGMGLFPVNAPDYLVVGWNGKITISLLPELVQSRKTESLRQLANEYGVSHEAIRRTIARAKNSALDKKLPKNVKNQGMVS